MRAAPGDDAYLAVNRANWDARAEVHVGPGGYDLDLIRDPDWISSVVRFDQPRLGDVAGLDGVHLQCHLGTDTIGLSRLGARMAGVDLSGGSLEHARRLAQLAGEDIEYVEADVYSATTALAGRRFDLVYTGIGALCWLPDIARWARVVAALLRPGGRLFVRDAHPVLASVVGVTVRDAPADREQQPWISGPGEATPALELPYWERREQLSWSEEQSYTGTGVVTSAESWEWNHALSEIIMAVLRAGLTLELIEEHPTVPWDAVPGQMELAPVSEDLPDVLEMRLRNRPERLPATFTLVARMPA